MNFYFPYSGSKRNEIKNIIELINLDLYDTIIEPFGGSVAFSRYLFNINKNKKYIICDINDELIFFCNNFYKNKINVIEDCKKKVIECDNKIKYDEYIKNSINIDNKDFLIYYLFKRKNYSIRVGLYPDNKKKIKLYKYDEKTKLCDIFFENVHYEIQDYKITMEKYKNNSKSLIFIDPPYINSCNELYCNQNIKKNELNKVMENIWKYIYDFFNECKCNFIMIVNDNFFMKILFNKWFYKEYSKKYESTKKEVKHCIYTNIN